MSLDDKRVSLSQHLRDAAKKDQESERQSRIDALQDKEARAAIDTIRGREAADRARLQAEQDNDRAKNEKERRISLQQQKLGNRLEIFKNPRLTEAERQAITNRAKAEVQQDDNQRLNAITARAEGQIDRVLDLSERNTGRRLSKDEYLERAERGETRRESFDRVSEGDRDADRTQWTSAKYLDRSAAASTERSQDRDQDQERDRERD